MKWLLDTNVVSEATRPRPEARVLTWINDQTPDDLAISIATLAELHDGASVLLAGGRKERFDQWIEAGIAPSFKDRTLALTLEILKDWLWLGRALGAHLRSPSDRWRAGRSVHAESESDSGELERRSSVIRRADFSPRGALAPPT